MEKKQIKISLQKALILCLMVLVAIFIIEVALLPKTGGNEIKPEIKNETQEEHVTKEFDNSDFSTSFLKMENNKKNMIYSPLSIKYALKMLEEGADGNTKSQIDEIISKLNLTKYDNIDKVLSLANAVYIRDTYSNYVKDSYTNTLSQKYNAEIKYDSFANAKNVNNWIEYKTLGIIKNMLSDNLVQNPNTEMLLINALAIDMEWASRFQDKDTYGRDFYIDNGQTMKATTMSKETSSDEIAYYKDKNVTALSMDLQKYNDQQLEFIAIMPNENLSEYINTFDMSKLNDITKRLTKASDTKNGLQIYIPKFSFDYNLKLKNDLINLGITDAFDRNLANFSNMSSRELYVSDALHKANIDFTEKGVKAAAVTAIILMDKAMIMEKEKPEEVKIDKPFLFVIKDKNTDEIWFIGTVYEPNSWEKDKAEYSYR